MWAYVTVCAQIMGALAPAWVLSDVTREGHVNRGCGVAGMRYKSAKKS